MKDEKPSRRNSEEGFSDAEFEDAA